MIRPAQFEDAQAIAGIHVASWRVTYRGQISEEFLRELSVEKSKEGWCEVLKKYPDSVRVSVEGDVILC